MMNKLITICLIFIVLNKSTFSEKQCDQISGTNSFITNPIYWDENKAEHSYKYEYGSLGTKCRNCSLDEEGVEFCDPWYRVWYEDWGFQNARKSGPDRFVISPLEPKVWLKYYGSPAPPPYLVEREYSLAKKQLSNIPSALLEHECDVVNAHKFTTSHIKLLYAAPCVNNLLFETKDEQTVEIFDSEFDGVVDAFNIGILFLKGGVKKITRVTAQNVEYLAGGNLTINDLRIEMGQSQKVINIINKSPFVGTKEIEKFSVMVSQSVSTSEQETDSEEENEPEPIRLKLDSVHISEADLEKTTIEFSNSSGFEFKNFGYIDFKFDGQISGGDIEVGNFKVTDLSGKSNYFIFSSGTPVITGDGGMNFDEISVMNDLEFNKLHIREYYVNPRLVSGNGDLKINGSNVNNIKVKSFKNTYVSSSLLKTVDISALPGTMGMIRFSNKSNAIRCRFKDFSYVDIGDADLHSSMLLNTEIITFNIDSYDIYGHLKTTDDLMLLGEPIRLSDEHYVMIFQKPESVSATSLRFDTGKSVQLDNFNYVIVHCPMDVGYSESDFNYKSDGSMLSDLFSKNIGPSCKLDDVDAAGAIGSVDNNRKQSNSNNLNVSPVYAASGQYYRKINEITANTRELPLYFQRDYTHRRQTSGPLGVGWLASGFTKLMHFKQPREILMVYWDHGAITPLYKTTDFTFKARNNEVELVFNPSDGLQTLKFNSGDKIDFKRFVSGAYTTFLPIRKYNPGSNYQYVWEYDTNGYLVRWAETKVGQIGVLASDPQLNYEYHSNNLLASVSNNGRELHQYTYDESNRLLSVIVNGVVKEKYIYGNPNFPFNITKVLNGNGLALEQIWYGIDNRVASFFTPLESGELLFDDDNNSLHEIKQVGDNVCEVDVTFLRETLVSDFHQGTSDNPVHSRYSWNSLNQTTMTINPSGNIVLSQYDLEGRISQKKYLSEKLTEIDVDDLWSRPGIIKEYKYGSVGDSPVLTATIIHGNGGVVESYSYNANSKLVSKKIGDLEQTIEYDTQGFPTRVLRNQMDGTSIISSVEIGRFEYNNDGRLYRAYEQRKTDTGNDIYVEYTYDNWGNVDIEALSDGVVTDYDYDSMNRVTKQEIYDQANPSEKYIITYEYDSKGRLSKVVKPNAQFMEYVYDGYDRVISKTDQFGRMQLFSYNSASLLESVCNNEQKCVHYTYDELRRKVAEELPDGTTRTMAYDGEQLVNITDGNGNMTYLTYDFMGRVKTRTLTLSEGHSVTTTSVYDNSGMLTEKLHGNGMSHVYSYTNELLLEKVNVRDAKSMVSKEISYDYDQYGKISQVGNQDRVITIDNMVDTSEKTVSDALRATKYTYNPSGQVKKVQKPNEELVIYEHDFLGRLIKQELPDGNVYRFSYDINSNLTAKSLEDGSGTTLSAVYHQYNSGNQKERTLSVDYQSGETTELRFVFNKLDQLLSMEELPAGRKTIYGYTDTGRVSTIEYPFLHRLIAFTYDGNGNKTNVFVEDTKNRTSYMQAFDYDALNRMTYAYSEYYGEVNIAYYDGPHGDGDVVERKTVTLPNGTKKRYYHDTLNRLKTQVVENENGTEIYRYEYTYNEHDQVTMKKIQSTDNTDVQQYFYDEVGRLDYADMNGNQIDYTFDLNDNLVNYTNAANPLKNRTFGLNGDYQDQLESVTYNSVGATMQVSRDAQGKRLNDVLVNSQNAKHREFQYDSMNRLTKAIITQLDHQGNPTGDYWVQDYAYLPGSRYRYSVNSMSFTSGTTETQRNYYLYNGVNELEISGDDFAQKAIFLNQNIYDTRFGALKLNESEEFAGNTETQNYLADNKNTVNAVEGTGTVTNTQTFEPHGEPIYMLPEHMTVDDLGSYGYTGRPYDPITELSYYRGRYFDSCSNRMIQPDPMQHGSNWYGYSSDPVNTIDPSGYQMFFNNKQALVDFVTQMNKINGGEGEYTLASGATFHTVDELSPLLEGCGETDLLLKKYKSNKVLAKALDSTTIGLEKWGSDSDKDIDIRRHIMVNQMINDDDNLFALGYVDLDLRHKGGAEAFKNIARYNLSQISESEFEDTFFHEIFHIWDNAYNPNAGSYAQKPHSEVRAHTMEKSRISSRDDVLYLGDDYRDTARGDAARRRFRKYRSRWK
jgi:RHS repeat-associated protein